MPGAAGGGWDCHVHVFDAAVPARGGHYRPTHQPLEAIEATAAAQGVRHLVLVQPSVYGHDNGLLLRALMQQPGRHRGVVVLEGSEDGRVLDAMQAAGVRGARLNGVSPVGESVAPERRFETLAPRLRSLGWHLQWYARAEQLPMIAALHAGSGITPVLDHLGGIDVAAAERSATWQALQRVADLGGWIKLSGWYRLGASAPYTGLIEPTRRAAAMFAPRVMWGSDWPHTLFEPQQMPPYREMLAPLQAALGDAEAAVLLQRQPEIYA
jgi:predicted TIM-barrel fold metal-dependent hydrolase